MIKNYFKIALRNLVKNKVYSFINIFGLAAGMAVAIMIGLWVASELNHDSYFKSKDKIAQIYQSQTFNGEIGTGPAIPRPLEFSVEAEYKQYFKYFTMSSWTQSRYLTVGEKTISKEGNFIQKIGPKLLDLKIEKGDENGLADVNSIMLSNSVALALFDGVDPIGKIVKLNNEHDLKVTAVFEDIPENNSFEDVKWLAPWEQYVATNDWIKNSKDNWGNNSFQFFVQLASNVDMATASEAIKDLKYKASKDIQQYKPTLFLHPMSDWYLRGNFKNGINNGGRIQNVWLFAIIGAFVLILACINFMNLSTARSEKRAKEVGIRKSIGSFRSQLIYQFLSESFVVVSLAFVLALVIVLLTLTPFSDLSSKKISFPWLSGTFWMTSLVFIIFTSLLAGSYPAFYLSSFQPVKVLKGTFKVGRFASIPRKVLVVAQFTVSVTLIIGTLVVFRQIQYSKDRPIGYDKEGLVRIPVMSKEYDGKYDLMRSLLTNSGAITEMSSSSAPTTDIWSNRSGFLWDGKPEGFQEDLAWTEVSFDYAKSLNLKVIQGRDFSRDFPSDSSALLINETAVKYMGLKNPIGTIIRDDDKENPSPPMHIIGVVKDMIAQSPYEPVKQGWYVLDNQNNSSYYNVRLNPANSASDNMKTIEGIFKKQFPNNPFDYQFVDKEYGLKFAAEEKVGKLAGVFTCLAIFISCLGLFGLASFVAERRTKEIGVRKVLGASVTNLWALLSKDFVYLVMISLLIASPIAYYFMYNWIQTYTYRTEISWWIFVISGLGALAITLLTVSFQAIKAALMNPVKSLKTE